MSTCRLDEYKQNEHIFFKQLSVECYNRQLLKFRAEGSCEQQSSKLTICCLPQQVQLEDFILYIHWHLSRDPHTSTVTAVLLVRMTARNKAPSQRTRCNGLAHYIGNQSHTMKYQSSSTCSNTEKLPSQQQLQAFVPDMVVSTLHEPAPLCHISTLQRRKLRYQRSKSTRSHSQQMALGIQSQVSWLP